VPSTRTKQRRCTRWFVTHPDGAEVAWVEESPHPHRLDGTPCDGTAPEVDSVVGAYIQLARDGRELPLSLPVVDFPCGAGVSWNRGEEDLFTDDWTIVIRFEADTETREIKCMAKSATACRRIVQEQLSSESESERREVHRPGPMAERILREREQGRNDSEIARVLWEKWLDDITRHLAAEPHPWVTRDGIASRSVNPDLSLRKKVLFELVGVFGDNAKGLATAQGWLRTLDAVSSGKRMDCTGYDHEALVKAIQGTVRSPRK
jgi:hypothetical protein